MAEIEQGGQVVGGLPEPSPREGTIRAQNARRVARRAQAAVLAEEVGRTDTAELTRFGETRRVGGRFERLQKVPERKTPERQGLGIEDFASFLQALSFGGSEKVLGKNSFLSSFGRGVLGLNRGGR